MGELDGKIAVITGAGSGIGRATAEAFVREGAPRLLGAMSAAVRTRPHADLGASSSRSRPTSPTKRRRGDVRLGDRAVRQGRRRPQRGRRLGLTELADVTVEDFHRIISVNLLGVTLCTKHAIRTMLPTGGGSIVNWASTGGMNATKIPIAVYGASKAA